MAAVASSPVRFLPVQMFVEGDFEQDFTSVAMYFQYTGNEEALQRVVDAFESKHGVFDSSFAPAIIFPTAITDEVLVPEEEVQRTLRNNRNTLNAMIDGKKHMACCNPPMSYMRNFPSVRVVRGHLSLFDTTSPYSPENAAKGPFYDLYNSPFSPENAAKFPFYHLCNGSSAEKARHEIEIYLYQCVFYCFGRWTAIENKKIVEATCPWRMMLEEDTADDNLGFHFCQFNFDQFDKSDVEVAAEA